MHRRQKVERDLRWCVERCPPSRSFPEDVADRDHICTAAWEAAAAGPAREARQTQAPRAPAYVKVNANLRGARSHLALVSVHLSSHPLISLPVPEQPPCGPRAPRGCGGAAGVMLHTCRKPLIKLEISNGGCRSSCVINHCAAG